MRCVAYSVADSFRIVSNGVRVNARISVRGIRLAGAVRIGEFITVSGYLYGHEMFERGGKILHLCGGGMLEMLTLHDVVAAVEDEAIRVAMKNSGGNQAQAARVLGINVMRCKVVALRLGLEVNTSRGRPRDSRCSMVDFTEIMAAVQKKMLADGANGDGRG